MVICILLGNFDDDCPDIPDSETVLKYEIRPELRPVKLFTSISSLAIFLKSLRIQRKSAKKG